MSAALVLLHGLASNSTRWWHFARHARLPGWRLVTPDLRGHAGSTDRGRIDIEIWCDDLARLLDAERCDRAVIGGHCLGANLALRFAARYPQRTAGLVLIEPMPPAALQGKLRRLAYLRPLLIAAAQTVLTLNRLGLHRRTIRPIDLEEWDRATTSGAADLARYAAPLSDLKYVPIAAYLQELAAMAEPLPSLGAIRIPALVLLARGSTMTDPARARAILQALPEVEIAMIEAKHWIPTEQPDVMRSAIESWLARNILALTG